jgi:hypothetical protein
MTIFAIMLWVGAGLSVVGLAVLQKRAISRRHVRRGAMRRIECLLKGLNDANPVRPDGCEHVDLRF